MNVEYVRKHGGKGTRIYRIWAGMLSRCSNPNTEQFVNYGARGITVCARWRESFETFRDDMGEPTTQSHSIDRIDNDGPYSPENCRWATLSEQARNRRGNTTLILGNESACLAEWAQRTGLDRVTISSRLKKGWTIEQALTRPLRGSAKA